MYHTEKQLKTVSDVHVELRADCHCMHCSENNECLSRGHCKEGYWGDNCMMYDILRLEGERQAAIVNIANVTAFTEITQVWVMNNFDNSSIQQYDLYKFFLLESSSYHIFIAMVVHLIILYPTDILIYQKVSHRIIKS